MISDFFYTIYNIIKSRIFIVGAVLTVLFGVVLFRLFDLQIINESYYMNTYVQQAEKTVYTPGTRGNIYDTNGELLAYNELSYAVTFEDKIDSSDEKNGILNEIVYNAITIIEKYGDKVSYDFPIVINSDGNYEFNFTSDASRTLFMTNLFGIKMKKGNVDYSNASAAEVMDYCVNSFFDLEGDYDMEMTLKIIAIRYNIFQNSYQKYVATTIATNISKETMTAIYENEAILTGVSVAETTIRRYVDSEYFAPLIGYTGKISESELQEYNDNGGDYISSDYVGKSGIEAAMEDTLQGVRGEKKIFVDSTGKVLSTVSSTDSSVGKDVTLTIDKKLQIATYKMLEKKIASVLISQIVNRDVSDKEQEDSDVHPIAAKTVYFQLINNNVLSIKDLKKKRTNNEAKVYTKYSDALKVVKSRLKKQLESDKGEVYNDSSDEYKEYYDYIFDELKSDNVLISSSLDSSDATYKKYIAGDISINEFIKYAISKSWINISALQIDNQYITSDETYKVIVNYILDFIDNNASFSKLIFKYKINDGTINGCEICMLLYDQSVLEKDRDWYNKLSTYTSTESYNFIISQIKKLNITPAQIALDPCSGSVVVTNPNNGKVLAMVTYPSYDNNMLSGSVDADYWAKLVDDLSSPLYNRATQGLSAPGSTFKMVTAMTALENNTITRYRTIVDKGEFDKISPHPKCWIYPSAHGSLNVMQAIAQSCNGFFYEVGYELGTTSSGKYDSATGLKKLEVYAKELGLDMKSGVEITESDPKFSTESAVHSAIGQGSHSYAPVQLARYISTLANGGKNYELTLVDKITDSSGNVIKKNKAKLSNTVNASSETWDIIHTGMRMVITEGTIEKSFKDTDIAFAGKTGTAEENSKRNAHSLFVAYAPYNKPKVAISAVIPFGNSSHDSAEVAKDVVRYYLGELTDDDVNKDVESSSSTSAVRD